MLRAHGPRTKSFWLALGPTQSPPELVAKHLVPSLQVAAPEEQQSSGCFVVTESFADLLGLEDFGFSQRGSWPHCLQLPGFMPSQELLFWAQAGGIWVERATSNA